MGKATVDDRQFPDHWIHVAITDNWGDRHHFLTRHLEDHHSHLTIQLFRNGMTTQPVYVDYPKAATTEIKSSLVRENTQHLCSLLETGKMIQDANRSPYLPRGEAEVIQKAGHFVHLSVTDLNANTHHFAVSKAIIDDDKRLHIAFAKDEPSLEREYVTYEQNQVPIINVEFIERGSDRHNEFIEQQKPITRAELAPDLSPEKLLADRRLDPEEPDDLDDALSPGMG